MLQHGQHLALKNLFQSAGIVPWMRPHVPLVFSAGDLLTVGGLWYAQGEPGRALGQGLQFEWTPGERLR